MMPLIAIVAAIAILIFLLNRTYRGYPTRIRTPGAYAVRLCSESWCEFEIVGESHYQAALAGLAGQVGDGANIHCTALLRAEPSNPHDPNAVRVTINGLTVGYLAREDAAEYVAFQRELGLTGRDASCPAYINGGFLLDGGGRADFGVKLGLLWPPEVDPA